MVLAFAAAAVVLLALLADLLSPRFRQWRQRSGTSRRLREQEAVVRDPGRERRAEQKARALLRSCVNEEEWEMYRDLGFIRVWGSAAGGVQARRSAPECVYLLYPHLPIVAYAPKTGRLIGEYCVTFEDQTRPYGSSRLPDADDVLAKWMALRGDEREVISMANMHLPGRQVGTEHVQRDLRRLSQWEREHLREPPRVGRVGQTDQHTATAS